MLQFVTRFQNSSLSLSSRGWFIREDYLDHDDRDMLKWVLVERQGEEIAVSSEDVPVDHYQYQPQG